MTETIDQVDESTEVDDAEGKRGQLEREHYREIRELNAKLSRNYSDLEVLKDQCAAAKKRHDELGKRLTNLIARGPDAQQTLDFDDTDEDVQVNDPTSDQWRSVQVMDALPELTDSQVDKLESEGIHTMGQLEDFRASQGLHTIKGFGEKAVTKIEDGILAWLDRNRDRLGEVVDEDQDEDEDSDQVDDDNDSPDEDGGDLEDSEDETDNLDDI